MAVNREMVDYIRTMLKGEHAENDRLESLLDERGWDGFPTLLGAVFYFAVNRRFSESATAAEIMWFVTEMRASAPAGGSETDANSAEKLIRAALDPSIEADVEPQMAGRIQGMVILHILGGGNVSDEELDALLDEAFGLAQRL
ncbi:hypothetical protein V6U90_25030 [Micromonospora sp. CPCC 206060]|uniref:hypothetical protein n=1 Tax=Micromonospora sp. CPCC 206060 TaxID=3122406 RepID=UPI002FEFEA60